MQRRLSVTFERKLQKSIQNKRLSTGLDPAHPKMRAIKRMFEQFFIIGAPPSFEDTPQPTIIVSYPTQTQHSRQVEEVDLITSFCFPTGFPKIPEALKKKKTIINEYNFCLAEGASKIYGICVVFAGNPHAFFASKQSCDYPFCLCMLTSLPYLSSHFQFLSYLALLLSYRIKASPHTTTNDYMTSFVQAHMPPGLVKDEEHPSLAVLKGIKGTKQIVDELDFYYSLPTSSETARLRPGQTYPIIKLSPKIDLAIPLHFQEEEALAHSSFHILFSIFTLDEILKIYTAMILEEHIIFVSEKLNKMTLCVMGIVSLLKPFDPMATMILPLLPYQPRFLDFLESPCPYIVGVTAPYKNYEMLVNLDKKEIIQTHELPKLPKCEELKAKIQAILDREMDKIKVPPKKITNEAGELVSNPENMRFFVESDPYLFPYLFTMMSSITYLIPSNICNEILNTFKTHLPSILDDPIKECFVTDTTDIMNPITVFNKDLFFIRMPPEDEQFYLRMMQTQIWEVYSDQLATQVANQKRSVMYDKPILSAPHPKIFGSMVGKANRVRRPLHSFQLPEIHLATAPE